MPAWSGLQSDTKLDIADAIVSDFLAALQERILSSMAG
jgi:hypothetical protein